VADLMVVGRGFCFEDLAKGMRFRTHRRTIAEADLAGFVNLTWLTEELFAVADDSDRAIRGRPVPAALVYAFAEGLLLPTMQDTGLAFLNATLDVKAPTLVVSGRDDVFTPPDFARHLAKLIRHARLTLVPGGHFLTGEQADTFTRILLRFLKGVRSRSPRREEIE